MSEIKLYRALKTNVGAINSLAVKLYKGEITAEEALVAAKTANDALTEKIKEIEESK